MAESAKPRLDLNTSYLVMIENSVGANLFRNLYFHIDGKSIDVLDDGDLSCAMFVSTILHTFGLMRELHTTVKSTLTDLTDSGWYKISEPRKGAVIHWSFKKLDNGTQGKHHHVGFYIDPETAISNSPQQRVPERHHPTYGILPSGEAGRDILGFYWHDRLDQDMHH